MIAAMRGRTRRQREVVSQEDVNQRVIYFNRKANYDDPVIIPQDNALALGFIFPTSRIITITADPVRPV